MAVRTTTRPARQSRPAEITNEVKRLNAYRSLAQLFERADRIIAGRRLRCAVVDDPQNPVPAWTTEDGACITFNIAKLGQLGSSRDYVRVTGVNFHELCHVLFTPTRNRQTAVMYQSLRTIGRAFNILEDQRIESMLVTMAPSTSDYFRAMFASYVLEHPDPATLQFAWILAHGRQYLGDEITNALRSAFAGTDFQATQIMEIIDEYRVLDLTRQADIDKATELAWKMHELLKQLQPPKDAGYQHGAQEHAGCEPRDKQHQEQSGAGSHGVKSGEDKRKPKPQQPEPKDEQDQGESGQGEDSADQEPDTGSQESDGGSQADGDPNESTDPDQEESESDQAQGGVKPEEDEDSEDDEREDGHEAEGSASPGDEEPESDESDESEGEGQDGTEPDEEPDEDSDQDADAGQGGDDEGDEDTAEPEDDDDLDDDPWGDDDLDGWGDEPSDSPEQGGAGQDPGGNPTDDGGDQDAPTGEIPGGQGAGTEAGDHSGEGATIEEIAEVMLNEVYMSPEVTRDYQSFKANVAKGHLAGELESWENWGDGVIGEATAMTGKLTREFGKIREDADPGYLREQSYGRLNIQRAMRGVDPDTAFDAWYEGQQDTTSLEVVVLVDISGSMSSHSARLTGAAWTIKRGLDSVQVPCTVIAYDTASKVVYKAGERATPGRYPNFPCTGGTEPSSALAEALAIFQGSTQKKKLLVTLTDGDWSPRGYVGWGQAHTPAFGAQYDNVEIVKAIRGTGVLTQMVYFDPSGRRKASEVPSQEHQMVSVIGDLGELPAVVRKLVAALMQLRLR